MRVGFIGLGLMGSGMTNNLQKAGHQLVLHDLRREAAEKLIANGAEWANSPRDLASSCEVVFTSLPGPPEFEAVALGKNGLLEGMQRGQALFDLSTNSPTVIRRLHKAFADKGAHLLDSPVSGGPAGAATGKMAIWVSGDERELRQVSPRARRDGRPGVLHRRYRRRPRRQAGAQPRGLHGQHRAGRVLHHGREGRRRSAAAVGGGAAGRRRPPAHLRHAGRALPARQITIRRALRCGSPHKDVSLATQLGSEVGVPMRLANLALEEMTEALGRGWQARDSRSSMILQQERAGVKVAVDQDDIRAVLRADSNN